MRCVPLTRDKKLLLGLGVGPFAQDPLLFLPQKRCFLSSSNLQRKPDLNLGARRLPLPLQTKTSFVFTHLLESPDFFFPSLSLSLVLGDRTWSCCSCLHSLKVWLLRRQGYGSKSMPLCLATPNPQLHICAAVSGSLGDFCAVLYSQAYGGNSWEEALLVFGTPSSIWYP